MFTTICEFTLDNVLTITHVDCLDEKRRLKLLISLRQKKFGERRTCELSQTILILITNVLHILIM